MIPGNCLDAEDTISRILDAITRRNDINKPIRQEHTAALAALTEAQRHELDSRNADHAKTLAREQARHESDENRYAQQLDALRTERQALGADLATAREALAAAQAASAEVRAQAETMTGANAQLEITVSALSVQLRQDQRTVSRLEERVAGLTRTLEATAAERDELGVQLASEQKKGYGQAEQLAGQAAELALLKESSNRRWRE